MFADTKAKVTSLREIPLLQFVFLDFETTFQDFFCFGASNSDMYSDLFVTTDAERSDGVSSFACSDIIRIMPLLFPSQKRGIDSIIL